MHARIRFGLALILVVALVAVLSLADAVAIPSAQAVGEPYPGTVQRVLTQTFYPQTALTGSSTVFSSSPQMVNGQDITRIGGWHSADVFVTADITSTTVITVTPQLSADQANWADANHITASWNSTGTATLNTHVYRLVLSADGTKYVRIPLAGEYLRFQIQKTGTVTPTILVTLRND